MVHVTFHISDDTALGTDVHDSSYKNLCALRDTIAKGITRRETFVFNSNDPTNMTIINLDKVTYVSFAPVGGQ